MSTLKELRTEAGLTQKELAERLAKALPPATAPKFLQPRVSAYESGRNTPPLEVAIALTRILNRALKRAGSRRHAKVEDLATKHARA